MKSFNNKTYWTTLKILNSLTPSKNRTIQFLNECIASGYAEGHSDQMNEDWMRNLLLSRVTDKACHLEYGQAIALAPIYRKAIESAKAAA